jgi:hypothetical protein
MPNAYDPYKDALVVEQQTVWPTELSGAPSGGTDRQRIEDRLHAAPASAAELEYVRLHAGFIRKITVTAADLNNAK